MSRRMRVGLVSLHTSPQAPPGTGDAGGMNVYLSALAGPLVANGIDVEVLTRRTHPDQPATVGLPGGALLRHLDAGPPAVLPKGALAEYAEEFSAAVGLLEDYDLVHSHYWLSGVAGLAVAAASDAPHVLSLHTVAALKNATLPPGDVPEPDVRIDAERELVGASALTVAATEAEAGAIRRFYSADPDSVKVVPPGVDRELFTPDGPRADWLPSAVAAAAGDTGYLLMAARTQPLKGQDVAIRALAAMPAAGRPPLVLIGDTSPGHDAYRAELAAMVAEYGLADAVFFLPAQPRHRLAEVLRGAALLLVPSRSETFGLVTLEAAACGVPSVASAVPGLTDAVADGVSGVHVAGADDADAFDPDRWAVAITELLHDPDRLAGLRRSARHYTAGFDWAVTAARIAGLYRRVLA